MCVYVIATVAIVVGSVARGRVVKGLRYRVVRQRLVFRYLELIRRHYSASVDNARQARFLGRFQSDGANICGVLGCRRDATYSILTRTGGLLRVTYTTYTAVQQRSSRASFQ